MSDPPPVSPEWFGMSGAIRPSISRWLAGLGWRYCPGCKEPRPLDEFTGASRYKPGKTWACRKCNETYLKPYNRGKKKCAE